jgi:uncharacterized paraquat-inducible protein A
VLELLGTQSITILGCPGCFARYNVAKYTGNERVVCPKCKTSLKRPESLDSAKVDGAVSAAN